MARRGGLTLFFVLLMCAILIAAVVTLICVIALNQSVSDALAPAPAPAPPPPVSEGECAWCDDLVDQFARADTSNQKRAVHCTSLGQSDFVDGTFIADTPDTCYALSEDVIFSPNAVGDFRADKAPYLGDPTFVLDFPAAFLVRAPGVTLDLSGFEIRQSHAHALQQRFFALIELTTPFIDGQGPADFVDTPPTPASRFTLRNGRVGLSSHHGVHGNGAWTVLIEDVDIEEYEVAAVALNGMHDVVLRRVRALGIRTSVPVLGTYSSARFLTPFVSKALTLAGNSNQALKTKLTLAAGNLHTLMSHTLADVQTHGKIDKNAHPDAYALFGNPTELPDGSAVYGFVLHAHGVAVNGFQCDSAADQHDNLHHILVEDCQIKDTKVDVVEVPVLQHVPSGHLQRGPAGDVLRVADLVGPGGKYVGTALSDTKVALMNLVQALGNPAGFGTLAVHPQISQWAGGVAHALANGYTSGDFTYKRNGDTMFHVNKGAFGIRVGGGHHIAILRTTIDGVENVGAPANMNPLPGETADDAYWSGPEDGGHPGAAPQHGYGGADAAGVTIAAATNVLLNTVTVRNVLSHAGWSTGVTVFNDAKDVTLHDLSVFDVHAHPDSNIKVHGPKQPRAVGVAVTTDAQEPTYSGNLIVEDIKSGRIGMACNSLLDNTGIDKCAPSETNFYTL